MIKKTFIIILSVLITISLSGNGKKRIVIENFESSKKSFFKKWLTRNSKEKKKASVIYKVKKSGTNRYLHARSYKTVIPIVKRVKWDLKKYPFLSWKWRVRKLPKNGNEAVRKRNDSAAAIYVFFQRRKIPFLSWRYQPINVIKYVWSSSLLKGRVVKKIKKKAGLIIFEGRFFITESGSSKKGRWIKEKRNVLNDYRNFFGKTNRYNPILIGILTDSNSTRSSAIADYDDIVIEKK